MIFHNKEASRCYLWLFWGCVVVLQNIDLVSSHGRMLEPPQRSSLWRFNYPGAEVNYNDNELFCGGVQVQWGENDGKCGLCGDPYQGPRLNEAGNKYGKGIIAKTYSQGAAIKVQIDLTANHLGNFEYGLCVHNNPTVPATEDCFDEHSLYIQESGDTKFPVTKEMGNTLLTMTVRLPEGVTCTQCILRWKYNTGNSWGCDTPESCGLGYGKQEQFINCADIAITDGIETDTHSTAKPQTSPTVAHTNAATEESTNSPTEARTETGNIESTIPSVADCPSGNLECVAVPPYDAAGSTEWCNTNCKRLVRICPTSHCHCVCKEEIP